MTKEIFNEIGNTPLYELKQTKKINDLNSNIYTKLEWYNPFGSIKDRVALNIILKAIENQEITPETIVIEATSGNTGIGLAGVCACLNIKCIIIMPEGMSKERKELIQSYHQEVIETPKEEGMAGAIRESERLAKKYPHVYLPKQFDNPNNYLAHEATAKEIFAELNGNVDIVVAGIGTGGTIMGLGLFLKAWKKDIVVIGVEPTSSPFITKGYAGKHLIQGIGAGFIPSILDLKIIDEMLTIDDEQIYKTVKTIEEVEGLSVGLSSACNYLAAIEVAKKYPHKNIVTIFPDDKTKYLSVLDK